jgi:hypothetical protein
LVPGGMRKQAAGFFVIQRDTTPGKRLFATGRIHWNPAVIRLRIERRRNPWRTGTR